MTSLIDSLLNSTRIIDGELYFHPTRFDMRALLHEVCHSIGRSRQDRRFWEDLSAQHLADGRNPKLLFQVLSNLLSKRRKNIRPAEDLSILRPRPMRSGYHSVQDHGMGIPEADVERLFSRYYRGKQCFPAL